MNHLPCQAQATPQAFAFVLSIRQEGDASGQRVARVGLPGDLHALLARAR